MSAPPPLVIDLEMSVEEYLQCLAQGRDPLKQYQNKSYELALIGYGISIEQSCQAAPLMEKPDCSIEERILVNRTLRQIWERLIGAGDRAQKITNP